MLPFQEAIVVVLTGQDPPDIDGQFDRAILDLPAYERALIDAVVHVLRPGSEVVVMIPPDVDLRADPSTFGGLSWDRVTTLGGRLGAVLSVTRHPAVGSDQVVSHMVTANAAYRAGRRRSIDRIAALERGLDRAQAARWIDRDHRRDSERALLNHLEALLRELEGERRRHRGLRLVHTVLQRHAPGRVLVRLLRPFVRTARRLRVLR
jgi:hypothetical protein